MRNIKQWGAMLWAVLNRPIKRRKTRKGAWHGHKTKARNRRRTKAAKKSRQCNRRAK